MSTGCTKILLVLKMRNPPDVQKSCWPWKCGLARIFVLISANCVGSVLLQHSHVLYVSWWVSPANCLGSVLLQHPHVLYASRGGQPATLLVTEFRSISHVLYVSRRYSIPLWIMKAIAVAATYSSNNPSMDYERRCCSMVDNFHNCHCWHFHNCHCWHFHNCHCWQFPSNMVQAKHSAS